MPALESDHQDLGNRLGVNSIEVRDAEEVTFLGSDWSLLPSVYPMHKFRSTTFFWECLKEISGISDFLEVGCGSGAVSILAVETGMCLKATAIDINKNAVANTVLNARRRGVESKVRALESDLFDSLVRGEKFDLIFWNSSGVLVEEGASLTDHERSFFDPGYASHSRYFAEGPRHLMPAGRLMLGFCGKGDIQLLEHKAAEEGLSMRILAEDEGGKHPHWLLEFCSTGSR
ncbi:methyltransferase [Micromonospora sp. NPDC005172]|uniref:methyltransferase domain-containing protein n=1 Tax=Micromonospora sp. NPDC005172 TaxID=3156867 RepID=UPI0033A623FA